MDDETRKLIMSLIIDKWQTKMKRDQNALEVELLKIKRSKCLRAKKKNRTKIRQINESINFGVSIIEDQNEKIKELTLTRIAEKLELSETSVYTFYNRATGFNK